MIKVENVETWGFDTAVRAMRHPMLSYDKSDSGIGCISTNNNQCSDCGFKPDWCGYTPKYIIGSNDLELMCKLFKAGVEHRTYARLIQVSMDVTAPLYFWKEADRYSVGKTQVSTSSMHTIHKKPFELDDFSHEHLKGAGVSDLTNGYSKT